LSVPIILKTAGFTFVVSVFLLAMSIYYGTVELFICAALIVVIFLLAFDIFEMESVKRKRKR
jgi:uncharacterized membrane protein